MPQSTTEHLLSSVYDINKKYDEINKITGERFNIFQILKVATREARTHSAFLAELLHPSGTHGYRDTFLRIFLSQQQKKHTKFDRFIVLLKTFESENARTTPEKHIGFISDDGSEGGRMDILIRDRSNRTIIIENKIYAVDQTMQLVRYNKAYPSAPIFYLSLYGLPPSPDSSGQLQEEADYVCISYKEDILDWLSACVEETVSHPLLHQTIIQYIHLIKYLTNQSTNVHMEQEIAILMASSKENIISAYTVRNSIEKMESMLTERLLEQLKEFAISLGLLCEFPDDFGKVSEERELNFYVTDQKEIMICLGFDKWRSSFFIGIFAENGIDPTIKSKITSSLIITTIGSTMCIGGKYSNWYYLHYYEDRKLRAWDTHEIWCEILDGSLAQDLCRQLAFIIQELKNIGVISNK
ncbi:MAG TPA: PD-(D/E)XK nuclease family protein [Puia sp.]|nr:PD-(D/E)XK nuclease family protein [Puia sp.]